jgi:cytochrome c biogenesis protein CcmG/thiol:disulfide interchange protein DsbE
MEVENKMKRNKWIFITMALAIIGFGAMLYATGGTKAQTAPDFTLQDLDGNPVSLSDYEGKVIMVNFWATWCGPCRMEIPGFIELQNTYSNDLVIVGVSMDQGGPRVVEPFVEKNGINYPVVYGNGQVATAYGGIRGIPTTFIIDRDFKIQRKYVGYQANSVFENDIVSLMDS